MGLGSVRTPVTHTEGRGGWRTRLAGISQSIGKGLEPVTRSSFAAGHTLPAGNAVGSSDQTTGHHTFGRRVRNLFFKFCSFIGPGFMIAVAYIDPGNYSTGVAAGATYQFRLLFVVLLANLFAIFLQTLCIKLGTASGLNLAQACRAFLPRWMNYILYFFAEVAIIATDIAEVIGFAIGLNLLVPAIPLVAGCAISILDVMLILLFYQPHGSMKSLRLFEFFIIGLVLAVVMCFCIQLSLIEETSVGKVFRGYVPSSAITEQQGLYQACGILGATVMPHSLYLGSGIVQPRLLDFDAKHGLLPERPLLSESISRGAGTVFALALLLSGVSAGIVCTITGQMVCEGALNWRIRPWLRRLITRGISIIPSIV